MEDKRIAKLLLSALLKMEIEDIEFQPKEFSTSSKPTKNLDHLPYGFQARSNFPTAKQRKFW